MRHARDPSAPGRSVAEIGADTGAIELVELAECMAVAPVLARWHATEWAHLYAGWDEAAALAEFLAMASPGRVPTTWVAFERGRRDVDALLGSISLIADDELDGYRHVGPWLASLFVVPKARGHGIGRRLVAEVLAGARRLAIPRLHLFTSGQEAYYRELGWRTVEHVEAHGHAATVMSYDLDERMPRRAIVSRWIADPHVGGAYSYLRVGGTSADRERLGGPIHPGLQLAGEATSAEFPGTAHGAWFSGERAASRTVAERSRPGRVVIVGAGLAGLAAARRLRSDGWEVVLLEAADEPGGRTKVDRRLGGALPLGAAWAHGTEGNPYLELALAVGAEPFEGAFGSTATYVAGVGRLAESSLVRLRARLAEVERRINRAAAAGTEDAPVGPVVRAELDNTPPGLERTVLAAWLRGEFENLYAAPVDDLSLRSRCEPFRLPGPDLMLVGDLGAAVARVADELDIRYAHAVIAVSHTGDAGHPWTVWTAASSFAADAVVVTVAVPVLQAGLIEFDPPLPPGVLSSLSRIGVGPVAKAFFTFDTAWWAPDPSFWCVAPHPLPFELWVDVSAFSGLPTLGAFAIGEHARQVELMSEDELCTAAADVIRTVVGPAGGSGPTKA